MKDNISIPFISDFKVNESLDWEMSRAEKYCLINILQTIKPDYSMEVGTYQGGSLQVISKFSKNVCSIDISSEPRRTLSSTYKNVDFVVGNSTEVMPEQFEKIEKEGRQLNFLLVDADHSRKGVYRDLKCVLDYDHKYDLIIILHDSFNPQCRKGIKDIDFDKYHNIEFIDLDYIPGNFWHNETYREMWGGFGLIKIGGSRKNTYVNQAARQLFETSYAHSIHRLKDPLKFLLPLKKRLERMFNIKSKTSRYFDFEK